MQRHKASSKVPSFGRFKTRIRFIAFAFGLIGLLCVMRLYYLQILQGRYYTERASNEFTLPSSSQFDRGTIYFTTKNGAHIAAATTQDGIAIGLNPKKLTSTSSQ